MPFDELVFRIHAIRRMFQRKIGADEVKSVLQRGETIESYPDDRPYPSRLVSGKCGPRPIHVVVADNHEAKETIVVTVYEPDPRQWTSDFKRRRP